MSEKISNADKPAYPTNARMHSDAQGMTKREMFAMAAMQGLISAHQDQIHNQSQGVSLALAWADELLKQLGE